MTGQKKSSYSCGNGIHHGVVLMIASAFWAMRAYIWSADPNISLQKYCEGTAHMEIEVQGKGYTVSYCPKGEGGAAGGVWEGRGVWEGVASHHFLKKDGHLFIFENEASTNLHIK